VPTNGNKRKVVASALIKKEFELAVMDIKSRNLSPNADGEFDEDCL